MILAGTDPKEVTKFGDWLSKTYCITVAEHRGKIHDYLGMLFDFSEERKVLINMIKYIKSIITNFPEEIMTTKMSPATDHLFKVCDRSEAKPLPDEQAMVFHHTTTQHGGTFNRLPHS